MQGTSIILLVNDYFFNKEEAMEHLLKGNRDKAIESYRQSKILLHITANVLLSLIEKKEIRITDIPAKFLDDVVLESQELANAFRRQYYEKV